MKITGIDCHVLLVPDLDTGATSSAQDDIVVFVHTDEGITGVGETDVNPWIAKACIEAPSTHTMGLGLKDMLLGEDPLDPERLWEKLYTGSAMNGRRGALICAMGAIDIALWDICGKAAGKPCWELLGRKAKDHIMPYASLQPTGRDFEEYRDSLVAWAVRARNLGFTAGKMEVTLSGPYNHSGLHEPDERAAEVVAACRKAVGPDFVMMVDVQYAWPDAASCLRTVRDWREFNLYFLETPIPIDDLKGYAQLLQRTLEKQGLQDYAQTLAKMDGQLTRLTKLLADLLDISKMQTGKVAYSKAVFDFNAWVHDIINDIQRASPQHVIALTRDTECKIIGDQDRLSQVFINLLTNAIKFSPKAERVDVIIRPVSDIVTVSVRDYGIGIAKEHHSRIFERFYRVTSSHDNTFPGLGIGLYISHEIIRAHEGKIWVESEEGKGSTFFVSLPLAQDE